MLPPGELGLEEAPSMQFSRAEVWNDLSQSWAPGFNVIEENERGYRVRRRSDGSLLPYEIAKDKVRAAES